MSMRSADIAPPLAVALQEMVLCFGAGPESEEWWEGWADMTACDCVNPEHIHSSAQLREYVLARAQRALEAIKPKLVREGLKTFGEEPLAYAWWVLPGQVEREAALQFIHEHAVNDVMEPDHGYPGSTFYDKPWVRSTRTRTLVVQRTGLDV